MGAASDLSARPSSRVGSPRRVASDSSIYACGVLLSEAGYAVDATQLQGYAARHTYTVLMANHGGPTGGWRSAGRSAIWAPGGALICAAPGAGRMLVVATWGGEQWQGEVREVSLTP